MAKYIDGFVLAVKKNRLNEYKKMALAGGKAWKKHGALEYFECVADDLNPHMPGMKQLGFKKAIKANSDEVVFYSFIVYKSKAHRDAVNKKVMSDPAMNEGMPDPKNMPFTMKKFAVGGFRALVEF